MALPWERSTGDTQTSDPEGQGRVVYYNLERIVGSTEVEVGSGLGSDKASRTTSLDLRQIEEIHVRFFFYYPYEVGFGNHRHDLESALFVAQRTEDNSCGHRVRLLHVRAAAHGSIWYENRLDLRICADVEETVSGGQDNDCSFPVTLLVEEGKHAVAPDRNGDGLYTPGYDVNDRVSDAWGVRDVIRSQSRLGSPEYSGSLTKPRVLADRIGPRVGTEDAVFSSYRGSSKPTHRYRLENLTGRACPEFVDIDSFVPCDEWTRRRVSESPVRPRAPGWVGRVFGDENELLSVSARFDWSMTAPNVTVVILNRPGFYGDGFS